MSETNDRRKAEAEENLEVLLSQASRRPMPPADTRNNVYAAVSAEWQDATQGRRHQRVTVGLALAASVAVAAWAMFVLPPAAPPHAQTLATVERHFGEIYLLGDGAVLETPAVLETISAGQTWVVGEGGLGVDWSAGGSLRIGADSRVTFSSAGEIYLHRGSTYFDSADSAELVVMTDVGQVEHVGTQYMVRADNASLVVNVRSGEVQIRTSRDMASAVSGEQVSITGNGALQRSTANIWGERWKWAEAMAPAAGFRRQLRGRISELGGQRNRPAGRIPRRQFGGR